MFSHGFHRITQMVWVCGFNNGFIGLNGFLGIFKGVHLSQVHQPSRRSINRASSAPTEQMNAVRFVGAAETAVPPPWRLVATPVRDKK